MKLSAITSLDRFPSAFTLRGFYGSVLGIIGSMCFVGLVIWMYLWAIVSYHNGNYFQSQFQRIRTPRTSFQTPKEIRMALVFYHKANNSIANHSEIKKIMRSRVYQSQEVAVNNYLQPVGVCDTDYFQDAVNPKQFSDCMIFPKNRSVEFAVGSKGGFYTYYAAGFIFSYKCFNPFSCQSGGSLLVAVQKNYTEIFQNYSLIFYFSAKNLQPDGSIRHKVYEIQSSSFNSPFTTAFTFDAETALNHITVDYSVLPWRRTVVHSNLQMTGNIRNQARTNTVILTSSPKIGLVSGLYSYDSFRYYKKIDWLLGIIGGGTFLILLSFSVIFSTINQVLNQQHSAQQLSIELPQEAAPNGQNIALKMVVRKKVPLYHMLVGWLPCYNNQLVVKMRQHLDIARMIKKLKTTQRIFHRLSIKLDSNPKMHEFNYQEINIQEIKMQEREHHQLINNQEKFHVESSFENLVSKRQMEPVQQALPGQNQDELDFNNQQQIAPAMQRQKELNQEEPQRMMNEINSNQHNQNQQAKENELKQLISIVDLDEKIFQIMQDQSKSPESLKNILQVHSAIKIINKHKDNQQLQSEQIGLNKNYQPSSEIKCLKTWQRVVQFCRSLDIYKVKVNFNISPASYSWVGLFFTFLVVGLSLLILGSMFSLNNTIQVFSSRYFQTPDQIKFTLVTGRGFRPAFCFWRSSTISLLTGSGKVLDLNFFKYSASKGIEMIETVLMGSNQHELLGIPSEHPYTAELSTQLCFRMKDGVEVPFGGYNTANEAYLGVRITGSCTGTAAFCNSTATLNSTARNFLSFMNSTGIINNMTMIIPSNQYDASLNSIFSGGIFANNLRQGTRNFTVVNTIEETMYVDNIQLIDYYRPKFLGQEPAVIEEGITLTRNRFNEIVKEYATPPLPYYQLRIRPSGHQIKTYLTGYTLLVILGMIGGIFFLVFIFFYCFPRRYNDFSVKSRLYESCYREQQSKMSQTSLLNKLLYFFLPSSLFSCFSSQNTLKTLQLKEELINKELDSLSLIKLLNTCHKLSTFKYDNLREKELALIYIKEEVYQSVMKIRKQNKVVQKNLSERQFVEDDESEYQEDSEGSEGQDKSKPKSRANQIENEHVLIESQKMKENSELIQQVQKIEVIDRIQIKVNQLKQKKNRLWQSCKKLDLFSSNTSLYLNGKSSIGSCFGFTCTLLTITIILIIFLYYIIIYTKGTNFRISYERQLNDPNLDPGLQLNYNNFRIALGFYIKPSFQFRNLSNLVNVTSTRVGISLFSMQYFWVDNGLQFREVKYDLVACTSNYFQNFTNSNIDPTYLGSLANGFCLPSTFNETVRPNTPNFTSFFRISVYNRTTVLTEINSLFNNHVIGILMTVPILNMKERKFNYTVVQVRPNTELFARTAEYNVTFSKQTFKFTTPDYTLGNQPTVLQDYGYIDSRYHERLALLSNTARIQNVTFSYGGLEEQYTLQYPNIYELFGYLGGIIIVVYAGLWFLPSSFNNFYQKYLIAKEIYYYKPPLMVEGQPEKEEQALIEEQPLKEAEVIKNKKNKKKKGKQISKYMKMDKKELNDVSEYHVFRVWIMSFINTLQRQEQLITSNPKYQSIYLLQSTLEKEIDFFSFYKRLSKVKHTLNHHLKEYQDKYHLEEPLTSLYFKEIISSPTITTNANKIDEELMEAQQKYQLSEYDLCMMSKFSEKELKGILGQRFRKKKIEEEIKIEEELQDKIQHIAEVEDKKHNMHMPVHLPPLLQKAPAVMLNNSTNNYSSSQGNEEY